jgi:hypothetical protein
MIGLRIHSNRVTGTAPAMDLRARTTGTTTTCTGRDPARF